MEKEIKTNFIDIETPEFKDYKQKQFFYRTLKRSVIVSNTHTLESGKEVTIKERLITETVKDPKTGNKTSHKIKIN